MGGIIQIDFAAEWAKMFTYQLISAMGAVVVFLKVQCSANVASLQNYHLPEHFFKGSYSGIDRVFTNHSYLNIFSAIMAVITVPLQDFTACANQSSL